MVKDVLNRKLQFLESRYDSQEHELLDSCPQNDTIKIGSLMCKECLFFEGVTFVSDCIIRIACSR